MSTKFTPHKLAYDHERAELYALDPDEVHARVATVDFDNTDDGEVVRADGERLALCWNCHDELVEALKASRKAWFEYGMETDPALEDYGPHRDLLWRIDAALASAGVKS